MDPKAAPLIKEPYFLITGENGQNITIVSPGKNGNEFNKTIGSFHQTAGIQAYHVVYGQGMLLMQRNDEAGEAKEIRVMSLKAGIGIEIPAGYGHCLVNVGKTYLVVIDVTPENQRLDIWEPSIQKHGFVYYLVDKKGDVAFEANLNYRLHPQITVG